MIRDARGAENGLTTARQLGRSLTRRAVPEYLPVALLKESEIKDSRPGESDVAGFVAANVQDFDYANRASVVDHSKRRTWARRDNSLMMTQGKKVR